MKLNIVMKFIISVGVPMVVIYVLLSFANFRSLSDLVQREGALRSNVSAELVANYLDGRLITIGTAARVMVDFAELDPTAARSKATPLLIKLLETESLIDSTSIAWGDPTVSFKSGQRAYRLQNQVKTTDLNTQDFTHLMEDYDRCTKPGGGWIGPLPPTEDLAHRCEYLHPIMQDDKIIGLLTVVINLEDLHDEAAKALPVASRFVIINDRWIVMSSTKPEDIGKPVMDMIKGPDRENLESFLTKITTERRAGQRSNSTAVPMEYDGNQYWIAWSMMDEPDWILVDAVPQAVMLEPVYSLIQRDTMIRLIGIAVIILAVIISSLLLTRRLRRLHSAMEIAQGGDFSVRVTPGRGRDELTRLGVGFNNMLEAFTRNRNALAAVEAERMAVDRELDIARNIQESLQPQLPPTFQKDADIEIAAVNIAARHVGGDFYDYWIMDDDHLAFMIGDVSGKGIPASLFMAVTRTTIRMVAGRERNPAKILAYTNESLLKDNNQGMFVTLFLGVCNIKTGHLQYANAGHHPALIKPESGSIRIACEATGTILGTLPDATWTMDTIQLDAGDHLILYTDGLTEAHTDTDNDTMLEVEGVEQHLAKHTCRTAQDVCDHLIQLAVDVQESHLFDDVTVMDLFRHGNGTSLPASDNSNGAEDRS